MIKLINEGKPLPEKYRFLLFEDKREVELVWNGKTRKVSTAIPPFQTLEHNTIAVKVIDIFGNDTMTLVPMNAA